MPRPVPRLEPRLRHRLAFVAGSTQRDPRRAALLGLGCTATALLGYFLSFRAVWLAEVAVGLALATAVLLRRSSSGARA